MIEIVDGNGSILKEMDKHLTKIIKTYIGNNKYYIKNTQHFVNEIKDITIEDNETLISYDVKALYPSVPTDETLDLIYKKLINDKKLKDKTKMKPRTIIFCL